MKIEVILSIVIAVSILGTIFLYDVLPDTVPFMRGLDGEIFMYSDKYLVLIMATIPLVILALLSIIPKLEPRQESLKYNRPILKILLTTIILVLIGGHWLNISIALGHKVSAPLFWKISIGLLFIILGNYTPRLRYNYTFGIRNPWTLANENIWTKVHRVGGRGFVLLGLAELSLIFARHDVSVYITISGILLLVIFVNAYSFQLWRMGQQSTESR